MKTSIRRVLGFLGLLLFTANMALAGGAVGSLSVSLRVIPAPLPGQDQSVYVHNGDFSGIDTSPQPIILADDDASDNAMN